MEKLINFDRELFLEINGHHSEWADAMMMFLTNTFAWSLLYLILLYLIIRNFRHDAWFILLGITLTILISDQITSGFMKPFFERLRPSHDPEMEGLVHTVNGYRGGKFGFASSHAANTMGLATYLWIVLKLYRPWIGLLFLWALLIGYTRIYLGVHYPGDIVAGWVVGVLAALASYRIFEWVKQYSDRKRKSSSTEGIQ